MTIRVRLACVAALVLLGAAPASFAQQADSLTAARSGALPGRGSVGGQVGGSWIVASHDYAHAAAPRFSFAGHFGYVISRTWRWQVSPYMTWNAYRVGSTAPFPDPLFDGRTVKDFYLTQLVGASAQIQMTRYSKGRSIWHVGAGPALYRVVVEDGRKVIQDPLTHRLHQGQYLGATAEVGVEHMLTGLPNTSLEWTAAYQSAFAKRDDQFPSGWNGMVSAFEVRFGAHYYYDFRKPKKPGSPPPLNP